MAQWQGDPREREFQHGEPCCNTDYYEIRVEIASSYGVGRIESKAKCISKPTRRDRVIML